MSTVALLTSAAAGTVIIADALAHAVRRRKLVAVALGPALILAVAAVGFTGYLLPWDQLGLWAVRVPSDFKGYRAVFGHQVRFVFIGHSDVSQSILWRWFLIHCVVLTLVAVALIAAALIGRRRSAPEPIHDAEASPARPPT
jgi:quinol-cytochrome oxidoreductase complex cytochrome b subunit